MCLARVILLCVLPTLVCSQASIGQFTYVIDGFNYIQNGDLEEYHDSPFSQVHKFPSHWLHGYQSPDYYHIVHNFPWSPAPPRGVPRNQFGYQWPRSGDGYASFLVEYYKSNTGNESSSGMEIFSNTLAGPLIAGRYLVTFYYSHFYYEYTNDEGYTFSPSAVIDTIFVSLNNLGETPIPYPSMETNYYEQFLPAYSIPVVQDTMNWQKAEVIVTAQGGEMYFSVGVFRHPRSFNATYISENIPNFEYWVAGHYLDDFSMYRIIDSIPVADSVAVTNVTLYPNPSPNGQFTLEYAVHEDAQPVFSVYDATGRLVGSQTLPGGQQRVPLDYSYLANGVYLWRLEQNQGFVGGGKMSVMR